VDLVFYDGGCGLCHRAVRFALRRDDGTRFAFAPLQGSTFLDRIPADRRAHLPDSLVILHGDRLLVKSDAVLHLLHQLGGAWRLLARLGQFLPPRVRDALYDSLARHRHHLFAAPAQACPTVPPHLQSRFHP